MEIGSRSLFVSKSHEQSLSFLEGEDLFKFLSFERRQETLKISNMELGWERELHKSYSYALYQLSFD